MIPDSPTNGTASAVDALYGPPTPPDLEALTRAERQAFRQAVAQIAATACAKLPESNGRIEAAVRLVLASDVTLEPDGCATVGSASDSAQAYQVGPGRCTCADFTRAPHEGLCKHRLAAAIQRRATTLLSGDVTPDGDVEPLVATPAALSQEIGPGYPPRRPRATPLLSGDVTPDATVEPGEAPPTAAPAPTVPPGLPEAPASANCHVMIAGRQVQVTLRDSDETRLLARLTTLLAQYPVAPAAATPPPPPNAQPPTPEGWCLIHQTHMTRNTNDRGAWWSHKRDDGGWCRGKAPRA